MMQLSFEQLKAITLGTVSLVQEERGVCFCRFTEEQYALYRERESAYARCVTPAGVRLRFRTNSETLGLAVYTATATSRCYFSVDVCVNGQPVGYLDNYGDAVLQGNPTQELPLGHFEATFDLGAGEKEVCIYLPWSVRTWLEALTLDDGAVITPVKPKKRLLAFGDSITQGYDAFRSANRYMARVADHLGMEEINKGVGAELFLPALAELGEAFTPDLITVAYGTNDWSCIAEAELRERCSGFFKNLRQQYPTVPIVALSPIWRKDCTENRPSGEFAAVDTYICEATAALPDVTVVNCFDFVPHAEAYYADLRLHPNDDGFARYAEQLCAALAGFKEDTL